MKTNPFIQSSIFQHSMHPTAASTAIHMPTALHRNKMTGSSYGGWEYRALAGKRARIPF